MSYRKARCASGCHPRGLHRTDAELLPAFLQPPVHHPQAGQLGHAHEVRPAAARLLRRENPAYLGMPTVQYCADKLCMSANYFGDLIKKMTGDTASNYIRQDLIQRVKNELASGANISQVAYELGFEYPQHLSRMFKKFCGYTPTDYLRQIQKKPGC